MVLFSILSAFRGRDAMCHTQVLHQRIRAPRQALDLRQGVGRAEPRLARAAAAPGRRRGGRLQSWGVRFPISEGRQSPREEGRIPRERRAVLQAALARNEVLRGRRSSINAAGLRAGHETEALGRDQGDDEARIFSYCRNEHDAVDGHRFKSLRADSASISLNFST